MRHRKNRVVRWAGTLAVLAAVVGCNDLLTVQNPQVFTDDAANSDILLPAVAAGAEGDMQVSMDDMAIMSGMLSDEFWHTGTWSDWLDVSKGRIRKNPPFDGAFSDPQNAMLRARGTAESAIARFRRVLGDTVKTSPLFVTASMARAWADLQLAMAVCEIPPTAGAATVSDTAIFKQAADSFAAMIPIIQAAHFAKTSDRDARLNQAYAGLARANLMIGNYPVALQYALLVPAGFQYDAIYSNNSAYQNNQMANQGNATYNRSFSIRDIWWPYIDTIAGQMRDPYSGQLDPRIPLGHDNNNARGYDRGSDGVTKFFSNNKYATYAAPIPLTKSAEMNLIIAEVRWRQGDFEGAMQALNINRAAVGLPPMLLPVTGNVSSTQESVINMVREVLNFETNGKINPN